MAFRTESTYISVIVAAKCHSGSKITKSSSQGASRESAGDFGHDHGRMGNLHGGSRALFTDNWTTVWPKLPPSVDGAYLDQSKLTTTAGFCSVMQPTPRNPSKLSEPSGACCLVSNVCTPGGKYQTKRSQKAGEKRWSTVFV